MGVKALTITPIQNEDKPLKQKKKTRGNGQGSIRQLPSGKWRWEVGVNGERFSGTSKNRTDAQKAINRCIADAERGVFVRDSKLAVGDYLTQWLEEKRPNRSPKSHEIQADLLRLHIVPIIGAKRLQKLRPDDLKALYASMTQKDLSASSQGQVHRFLRHAFREAVEQDLITKNLTDTIKPTQRQTEKPELPAYTPDEAKRFVDACREDLRGAWLEFAISTGMRRGEICGLQWADVDFTARTIKIQRSVSENRGKLSIGTPKTANSIRTIYLSNRVIEIIKTQKAMYDDHGWNSGFIFPDTKGNVMRPDNIRRIMKRICEAAKVRAIRIHGLRHTYASLSLRSGTPVEVVSQQLGHSTVAFTLECYRTVYQSEHLHWAKDIDDLTQYAPNKKENST